MCCGSIIFTDEFEEFEVDTNKWIPQQYIPSYTDDDVSIKSLFAKKQIVEINKKKYFIQLHLKGF